MQNLTRRHFIGLSIIALTSIKPGFATLKRAPKSLKLFNTHTGETLVAAFEENGETLLDNLQQFDYLLRDHRENEVHGIDPLLFYRLHAIQKHLGIDNTIEVISGYRSPKTNEMLRSSSSAVAKKSYHTMGRAIDIRMRGVATTLVRDTAIAMNSGGVGYYASSDFVHLDTGPARSW